METEEKKSKTFSDIFKAYKKCLEEKNKNLNNFVEEFSLFKEKNRDVWTDFLDIFIKYSFPYSLFIIENTA